MNRCAKCNVMIADDTDKCPLCQHVLETDGSVGQDAYPDAIRVTKKFRFLENLALFLSLLASVIVGWFNYEINPEIPWSLVVILILIYGNIVIKMAVIGRSGYMFKTFCLTILAIVLLLGIDYLTGYRGWSLDYVLPGGILLIDAALLVLMLVNRRNWQSYMMSEILMILLSLIPLILLFAGVTKSTHLTLIAIAVSVFLFLGTLILGDQRARTELHRRFHI